MLSSRIRHTLLNFSYILLILTVICALGISCFALIAQAVRVSPTRSFQHNSNVVIIGGSYVLVLVISLLLCIKRRVAVRQRLSRISKVYRAIGRNDVPKSVHNYITQEYGRACLVTYLSQPTDTVHEGWGRPGTKYEGIRFRRALLDAIPKIDALAHMIIPSHPALKPHTRMLHHFRYLLPLLPEDEDGLSILHYYDSSVQLARNSTREPTEKEFEMGIEAADEIMRNLHDVLLGMQEESTTQLNGPIEQL